MRKSVTGKMNQNKDVDMTYLESMSSVRQKAVFYLQTRVTSKYKIMKVQCMKLTKRDFPS